MRTKQHDDIKQNTNTTSIKNNKTNTSIQNQNTIKHNKSKDINKQ